MMIAGRRIRPGNKAREALVEQPLELPVEVVDVTMEAVGDGLGEGGFNVEVGDG